MSIQHAMLGLLARGPRHGYELKSDYEKELAPGTRLNYGQVYQSLDRLDRAGWVARDVIHQATRPDRKVYSLTDSGREELDRWIATPVESSVDARDETFLKLVLARRLEGTDPFRVIEAERRACLARLHEIVGARARNEDSDLATEMLLDLAALRQEAVIQWLDHCEESLRREGRERGGSP